MTQSSRIGHFLAGVLGGLVVLVLGAVLIATDVIDTGDDTRQVVQQAPISNPNKPGSADGLTVSRIYDRDGPGVAFIRARVARQRDSIFGTPSQEQGVASGSGFVLDREGYVLTNAHVVQGARDVTVTVGDGDEAKAEVKGSDLDTDLAVLKVDPKDAQLKPLELGDSDRMKVGDPTVAIGNPFGLDRTVTTGIVSALQRQIPSLNPRFTISDVIQTDASINPGNSGGPLLDATGKVIGINSQILTGGGQGSVGIGFAIPINTAKNVIPQLKKSGRVERAFLGVTTAAVTRQVAEDLNLPRDRGALVQDVENGGPADDAGLRGGRTSVGEDQLAAGGDLIVKVVGKDIARPDDVAAAIADNKAGDTVRIEFFRGDERRSVRVKLAKRPQASAADVQRQQDQPSPDGGGGLIP